MSAGTVVLVEEQIAGSELIATASIGASTITVDNPTDFTAEGGTLIIDPDGVPETKAWTTIDEVTGIITLSGTLASAHAIGDRVYPQPYQIERFANVALEDQEELLVARVPHSLYDRLPVGLRDEALSEMELVELQKGTDGELVVSDVLEVEPTIDGSFIDPVTLPPNPTDGSPPSASPTPTVQGGIGSLQIKWTAISNADAVVYEVHVSTSSGFTPGPTTLAGLTGGTLLVVHRLPSTSVPLESTITYFVKLKATDADGSAAAGTEASGSPRQADVDDLAVGSVVAGTIAANAVTADTLESVLALVTTLLAGTADAGRVEIGVNPDDATDLGIRAYDSLNVPTLRVVSQDGSVYIRGRLDFGSGSRLLSNDIIELMGQASAGFQLPTRVQGNSKGRSGFDAGADFTTVNFGWPAPTTPGNLLFAVVSQSNSGGAGTPDVPTIPGWTQIQTATQGSGPVQRQTLFKIEAAATRSGAETLTVGSNTRYAIIHFMEYSGVGVIDITTTAGTGNSASPLTGSTGTLAQANEVLLAAVCLTPTATFGAFSDGFTLVSNGSAGHEVAVGGNTIVPVTDYQSQVAEFVASATTSKSTGLTLLGARQWIAQLVTFKALVAGAVGGSVATPDAGKARLYVADDADSDPALHVITDDGQKNSVALGPPGVAYRMQMMSAAVDIPSTLQQAGGAITVTLTGVVTGDIVVWIGSDVTSDGTQFIYYVKQSSVTTNAADLIYFNADDATRNPASATHYFLVFHVA